MQKCKESEDDNLKLMAEYTRDQAEYEKALKQTNERLKSTQE